MSAPTKSTKPSESTSPHAKTSAPTIILNDCRGVSIYASPVDGCDASSRPPVSRDDVEETRIHIAVPGHAHESMRPHGPRADTAVPTAISTAAGQHPHASPGRRPEDIHRDPDNVGSNSSALPHPDGPSFWTPGQPREQPHPNSPASTGPASDADDTPSVSAAYTRPAHVLRPGCGYPYIPYLYNPNARTWIPINPSAEQWGPPGYSTPSPTESDVDDTAAVGDDDTDEDTRLPRQGQGSGARVRRYGGPRGGSSVARGRFVDGQDPSNMTESERERYAARLANVYEQAVRTDLRRAPLVVQASNGGRQNGRVTRQEEASSRDEGRAERVQSRNSGSSEETLVERDPIEGREGENLSRYQ